jgi:arylsulfatase A-like enzyme
MIKDRLISYWSTAAIAGLLLFIGESLHCYLVEYSVLTAIQELQLLTILALIPAFCILLVTPLAIIAAISAAPGHPFLATTASLSLARRVLLKTLLLVSLLLLLAKLFSFAVFYGLVQAVVGFNTRQLHWPYITEYAGYLVVLGYFLAAIVWAWLDELFTATVFPPLIIVTLLLLVIITVTFLAYHFDAHYFVGRYQYFFHLPLALIATGGALLAGLLITKLVANKQQWRALILPSVVSISLLLALAGVYQLSQNQVLNATFWRESILAKKYLLLMQGIIDFDRDQFSPLLGGDCDDFSANTNPLAVDDQARSNCLQTIDNNNNIVQPTVNTAVTNNKTPLPDFATVNQQPLATNLAKNLLMITIDCLRADHLGIYGYSRPTSPNLDKFATEAIVFENAFALGTNTGHSFSGIARAAYGEAIFDSQTPTLAEQLTAQGYLTAAITSPKTDDWLQKQDWESYKTIMLQGFQEIVHTDPGYWNAKRLTNRTISYLKSHADKPFYLWVHYNDLHAKNERYKKLGPQNFGNQPQDIYDANMVFTDQHLGRLLTYLAETEQLENTVIAISADHGEEFLEHGQQFHNGRPYRVQTHVPLILWYPRMSAKRVNQPVSTIDIAPTFLRAVGIIPPVAYQGVDLLATATDKVTARPIFTETPRNVPQADFFAWSVVQGQWHLIYDLYGHTLELFNYQQDPQEKYNLIQNQPEKTQQMIDSLDQWLNNQAQDPRYRRWARF